MWDEAGSPSNNNIIGQNPFLIDPENGNYQPQEGSEAVNYGCQTFANKVITKNKQIDKVNRNFRTDSVKSLLEVGGNISEDTFWNADTVNVVSDILIENGVTLTIADGANILFSNNSLINVLGTIKALGLPDSRINFSGFQNAGTTETWSGIIFDNTSAVNDSSIFKYCDFSHINISNDRIGGVFSFSNFSKAKIYGCKFINNEANYGCVFGLSNYSSPIISNCLFMNNVARLGGSAFLIADSYPKIINNTIVENIVENPGTNTETATIHTYISKPFIENNIIRENTDNYYQDVEITEGKPYYIVFNDIEQDLSGGGNIDIDPEFIIDENHLYSLSENSPCIDAGNNDEFYNNQDFDLIGNVRIVDGNSDGISKIDMGTYEFVPNISNSEEVVVSQSSKIEIYPNPFSLTKSRNTSDIKFKYFSNGNFSGQMSIFNIKGQIVKKFSINIQKKSNLFSWNCKNKFGKNVKSGIYFVKISDKKKSTVRKFLILK